GFGAGAGRNATERSMDGRTVAVVTTDCGAFGSFGSDALSLYASLAVFVTEPVSVSGSTALACGITLIVSVTVCPAPIVPIVSVSVVPVCTNPPVEVTGSNWTLGSSVSVKTTPVAAVTGLRFWSVTVYVRVCPTRTGSGLGVTVSFSGTT